MWLREVRERGATTEPQLQKKKKKNRKRAVEIDTFVHELSLSLLPAHTLSNTAYTQTLATTDNDQWSDSCLPQDVWWTERFPRDWICIVLLNIGNFFKCKDTKLKNLPIQAHDKWWNGVQYPVVHVHHIKEYTERRQHEFYMGKLPSASPLWYCTCCEHGVVCIHSRSSTSNCH